MSTQFFDLSRLALINGRLNLVTPSGETTPLTHEMFGALSSAMIPEAPVVANAQQTWLTEPSTGDVILWPYGVLGFGAMEVEEQEGESVAASIAMSEDGLTITLKLATDGGGVTVPITQGVFEGLLDELIEAGQLASYTPGDVEDNISSAVSLTAEIEGTAGTPGLVGWAGQIDGLYVVCKQTDATIANHYWAQPAYD